MAAEVEVRPLRYNTVAVSQSNQTLIGPVNTALGSGTGSINDVLEAILVIPGTTAAGAVTITDGSGSAITVFAGGGTTALTTLIPFVIPLGVRSQSGPWKITTGANVTAIAMGYFT